jgi:hypothetical protein
LNVNHFKLWLNILGCEHVDQKILAIEMATEIKSLFFNRPYFFNFFLFVIKFMSSYYDQDVDKSIKKSWALKWQPKSSCSFLMGQILFQFYFILPCWSDLACQIVIRVWIGRSKNLGPWDGDQNQGVIFLTISFFIMMVIKFMSLDYKWGVDRLIEKCWYLRCNQN